MQLRYRSHRLGCGCVCGSAVILGDEVGFILTGDPLLLQLRRSGAKALFACCRFLGCGWTHLDAAATAVVAHAVYCHIANHCAIHIGVTDHRCIHAHDCGVVVEIAAIPASAVEAHAAITVAVIHATVEADLWTPITCIPKVAAVIPAPVARGPEQAHGRGHDPGPRDPIVTTDSIPSPVAGGPHVIGSRTERLFIDRQFRGSNSDRNAHCNLRKGRARQRTDKRDQNEIA